MPLIRPSTSSIARSTTKPTSAARTTKRPLSSTPARQAGHAPQYDPPTGWLFGVQPGTKPKKEPWENLMIYGYGGGIVAVTIAYMFKPDTSIQTWALEEARRRLEKEGILPDPDSEK